MELLQPDMEEVSAIPGSLTQPVSSAVRLPSYYTTRWPIVNRTLAIVDNLSGGRAGWVQRFFSFAFFGGCAALTNLLFFYIIYYKIAIPVVPWQHNIIAYVIANEISIFANFIPNDYFTFSHLAGQGTRTWGQRCVRYHITSLSGSLLTFLIQFGFTTFLHTTPILGEAVAIFIVLFYNFAFHHIFTYRHVKAADTDAVIRA
jgi:putative flippase GtrA